jgi:hypothetical protein
MAGAEGAARARRSGRTWTDDDILSAIRAWAALYGAVPAMMDWDCYRARRAGHHWRVQRYETGDWPSTRTVCVRFGSFGKAVRAAGLVPRPQGARQTRTLTASPPVAPLAVKTTPHGFTVALSTRVREVAAAQAADAPEELRYALFGLARQALAWAHSLEDRPPGRGSAPPQAAGP